MVGAMSSDTASASVEPPFDDLPTLVRFARGLSSLRRLRRDPDDTLLALRTALLLNTGSLARLLRGFEASEEGRETLRNRPALDNQHVDLDALLALPKDTLGHAYAHFLRSRGLTPEVFVPPREIRDERKRYISQRLRQTHDLWHVVSGYDTDVTGEVEVQAFTLGQLLTPFAFFVVLGGFLEAPATRSELLRRVTRAFRRGRNAKPLSYRAWERRFVTPLSEVRAELGLA
jgi:ubiquinone biosynthesis protein COQ4